jgi:hypothetical protein
MRLRHATFARNLSSILKAGLLCSKSQGKLPVVWLGSAAKSLWAAAHVVHLHGGRIEQVVVLEVTVPRPGCGARTRGCGTAPATCRRSASAAP